MAPIRSLGQAVTGNHRIEKSNITKSFRNIKKYININKTAKEISIGSELTVPAASFNKIDILFPPHFQCTI